MMSRKLPNAPQLLLLAAYAALVLAALGATPPWLDELQQLGNVQHRSRTELLVWIQANPGASPVAYLLQAAAVRIFGVSTVAARLPAALCGILSAIVFAGICRRLRMEQAGLALALFVAVPIQFRYAMEARAYSQGLLFSLTSLWLLLRLREKPSGKRAVLYGLSILLGLYSQPLTVFPALAQALWAIQWGCAPEHRRFFLWPCALALLGFLPWLVLQRQVQAEVGTMGNVLLSAQQASPLAVLRDLTGGGYATTVPLVMLAACAFLNGGLRERRTALLGWTVVVCWAGPIAMDAAVKHLFAARQLLFATPSLVALAALGTRELWQRRQGLLVLTAIATFLAAAGIMDYRLAATPKDDFGAAARVIRSWVTTDSCIVFGPPGHIVYYTSFHPDLEAQICPAGPKPSSVVAVLSPYASATVEQDLANAVPTGYTKTHESAVGRIRVSVYRRLGAR